MEVRLVNCIIIGYCIIHELYSVYVYIIANTSTILNCPWGSINLYCKQTSKITQDKYAQRQTWYQFLQHSPDSTTKSLSRNVKLLNNNVLFAEVML